jgi:glycosyltransferase involved in cell wall biosynthesis
MGNISVRRIPPRDDLKGKGWEALGPILLLLIRTFFLLIRTARRYDIILVFGLKVLSIPAVLVSMLTQKKCVIGVQTPIEVWGEVSAESLQKMHLSPFSIPLKLWRRMRNMLIRRVDRFIAASSEIGRELMGVGVNPQKIRCIPNGIDTDKFRPVPGNEKLRMRQKLSLPVDKRLFIFTGRLAASKGLLLLIQVWNELVQKHPDIHLVLVGSGKGSFDNCEDELKDYIKLHRLEQSVSLTGDVDNVHEYLQASDVFVFPSEYEGFGMSIVEALACALPAVVTRVGVAREHIQDRENGILINPKDEQGTQEAIEWLLSDKDLWATLGMNARKGIVEKYSLEAMTEKYLGVFRELCGSQKKGVHSNTQSVVGESVRRVT